MGILTVKLNERDEGVVGLVKLKHHIGTKTKALLFCLHNQAQLESEIEKLQQERNELLTKIAHYHEHSLELLSGISGLQRLTNF
ncbi:hypothetical protein [Pedobacter sp. WC2423]|uniref:hypothetical protein n=1 Tax=Pedobacter sp. WC2423 TaxID=3234142 RepID=UPI003467BC28